MRAALHVKLLEITFSGVQCNIYVANTRKAHKKSTKMSSRMNANRGLPLDQTWSPNWKPSISLSH